MEFIFLQTYFNSIRHKLQISFQQGGKVIERNAFPKLHQLVQIHMNILLILEDMKLVEVRQLGIGEEMVA